MAFGWQTLIPLSFVNLIIVAVVVYYHWPTWSMTLISLPFVLLLWRIIGRRSRGIDAVATVKLMDKSELAVTTLSDDLLVADPSGAAIQNAEAR